jgi:signal transduction histidine kinase
MGRINESVDQLNEMISEILHENRKHSTSLKVIFESVLSQISPVIGSETIHLYNNCEETLLEVNKIRFTRMIINIINNSLSATKHMNGEIIINVADEGTNVRITINDNGIGIEADHLDKIKERGFSTKGSSGLGLQYVEKVIQNHGGTMSIESVINIGTTTTIIIPKGEAEYEKHFDN